MTEKFTWPPKEGQVIGDVTVLRYHESRRNGPHYWVKCNHCGKEWCKHGSALKDGASGKLKILGCKTCAYERRVVKHSHAFRAQSAPAPEGMTKNELLIKKFVEKQRGVTLHKRGWPDFWFVDKNGLVFMEAKTEGDALSTEQRACHAALKASGLRVEVVTLTRNNTLRFEVPVSLDE